MMRKDDEGKGKANKKRELISPKREDRSKEK